MLQDRQLYWPPVFSLEAGQRTESNIRICNICGYSVYILVNVLEYKMWNPNANRTGSTISKEWTTPDFRKTPSTTNLEEEEIVDAPGNDGNASMPEQVKRPNAWRKMMMMMMINVLCYFADVKRGSKGLYTKTEAECSSETSLAP